MKRVIVGLIFIILAVMLSTVLYGYDNNSGEDVVRVIQNRASIYIAEQS